MRFLVFVKDTATFLGVSALSGRAVRVKLRPSSYWPSSCILSLGMSGVGMSLGWDELGWARGVSVGVRRTVAQVAGLN
ncbi:hypothetical protein I3842_05G149000 [Carya illinoinensis]|uniref:Uncharacterized protein n=1 Tax=Carya illinoinensis TaxID=32201 RepID=A0A922EZP6_CARIL|nr:hypothetical protein I3842_05G149000 [Carya illinoinensis]